MAQLASDAKRMLCTTHKSGTRNTAIRRTSRIIEPQRSRSGAGNRHRANGLPFPRVLQAKLSIGKANDPFEREADRVASEVMRVPTEMNETNVARVQHTALGNQSIQRQCACKGSCDKCKKKQLSLKRVSARRRFPRVMESVSEAHFLMARKVSFQPAGLAATLTSILQSRGNSLCPAVRPQEREELLLLPIVTARPRFSVTP